MAICCLLSKTDKEYRISKRTVQFSFDSQQEIVMSFELRAVLTAF